MQIKRNEIVVRQSNMKSYMSVRNKMSKQQNRSELGIISDVLQVAMNCGRRGVLISSIVIGANLSHYTAIEKCQKLVHFGLMKSAYNGKNQIYSITENGIQFFQELQKFIEVVKQAKIRY